MLYCTYYDTMICALRIWIQYEDALVKDTFTLTLASTGKKAAACSFETEFIVYRISYQWKSFQWHEMHCQDVQVLSLYFDSSTT